MFNQNQKEEPNRHLIQNETDDSCLDFMLSRKAIL
jgi:hypothetical protein